MNTFQDYLKETERVIPDLINGWWFGTMEFYGFPFSNVMSSHLTIRPSFFRGQPRRDVSTRQSLQNDGIPTSLSWDIAQKNYGEMYIYNIYLYIILYYIILYYTILYYIILYIYPLSSLTRVINEYLAGGLEPWNLMFHFIYGMYLMYHLPIEELHHFSRWVGQPPTRYNIAPSEDAEELIREITAGFCCWAASLGGYTVHYYPHRSPYICHIFVIHSSYIIIHHHISIYNDIYIHRFMYRSEFIIYSMI